MYDPTYQRLNVAFFHRRSRQRARWGAFLLALLGLAALFAAYLSLT